MNECNQDFRLHPARHAEIAGIGQVCRLGLASRGDTGLSAADVLAAIDRGINYLNWCGYADGLSAAIRALGPRRRDVCLAVQLNARTAIEARRELAAICQELATDYLDVVTYYYVESQTEWDEIMALDGAAKELRRAQRDGQVRIAGITSHQRPLAAEIARKREIELLMIRYNAAHRGAEEQIFPVTERLRVPVVAYTALRWGALLQPTPDDPPDFRPPSAADCYRFVLGHPAVTVAIMAPDNADELRENLAMLDDWRGLDAATYAALVAHGDRVRRHAGSFP